MDDKKHLGKCGAIIILVLIGALISVPLHAQEKTKQGGMFRYCDLKSPGILDPPRVHQNQDVFLASNLFNGLVNLIPGKWEVYPDLAENFEVSKDKMVYTFSLRKGVKFHHGREVTSDDVVYSLKRHMEPKYFNSEKVRGIGKIEAPDRHTVRITLKDFDPIFLVKLAGPIGSGVVPKEYVEKYGDSFSTTKESTCGTGPYTVKEWEAGRGILLQQNPQYFRGRPNVDLIEMRAITSNATEVMEFEAGGLDMAALKPPYDKKFLSDPKWKPYCQSAVYPNLYWYGFDVRKPPFSNVKLRKAFAYALDRERAVKIAGGGLGKAAYHPLPPGFEGYDASQKTYAYDPNMVKRLLTEAGYPNGITLKMQVWNFTPQKQYTEFYQAQVAELGIKLEVEFIEMGTFRAENDKGKYPFYGNATSIALPDSAALLYKYFHSDNYGAAGNNLQYKNEEVDRLIKLAMKERDNAKRADFIQKTIHLILEDCPWVFCHQTQRTQAIQPWVHGLEGKIMNETGRWVLINFGDHPIWVDGEKQKAKQR